MTREEAIKILKELAGYEKTMDLIRNYSVSVQDALYMAIKALEKESKTDWIPVSERLPEDCKSVLVYCPTNDNIFCAYIERGEWKIFSPIASEKIKEVVTAWMPLTEFYKAEGGEA